MKNSPTNLRQEYFVHISTLLASTYTKGELDEVRTGLKTTISIKDIPLTQKATQIYKYSLEFTQSTPLAV